MQPFEGVSDGAGEPGDVSSELLTKGLVETIIMFVAHLATPVFNGD